VYACGRRSCTLRFADPQPTDDQLSAFYAQYYYGDGEHAYENSPESSLEQVLCALQLQIGPLGGKHVLDFGCGIGTLCKLVLGHGAQHVDATEPDPNARELVSRQLGIQVMADLDELRRCRPARRYDLITMVDVIEHLRSPIETLAELESLLQPRGVLFIETPDIDSLKARLVGMRWGNYQNPTHLYYFNGRALSYTLRLAGFSNAVRWRPTVTYPSHGDLRRVMQTGLQQLGLDGALRVLVRTTQRNER